MNELQIFNNDEFGTVRAVEVNGEPYFVGKDVAEILGYSNSRKAISDHVDEEDKGVTKCDTLGGVQELTVINESGLYSLILRSQLPSAHKFKRWVTSEVLPTIRKHGVYAVEDLINNPDALITALTALKQEREQRKALQIENDEMKPKAIFADAVTASDTCILIRELAKLIRQNGVDMGEKRLYKWMRNNGFIIQNSTQPTQKAMEMGLFEVVERTVQRADMPPRVTSTTKVTGKGQKYFINKILGGR